MINLDFKAVDILLPKIGADAFGLLIAISRHMDIKKKCFPSRHTLMRLTGLKKDAYYKAMGVLKTEKVITSYQKPGEGGTFGKNIFSVNTGYISVFIKASNEFDETVSEIPEPCPTTPDAVTPDAVTPDAVTPDAVESDTISITSIKELPVLSITKEEGKKIPAPSPLNQKTISHSDRPLPKTDGDLKNKLLLFLNAENDISQEARRAIFEKIQRRRIKIPGGLTLNETLVELIDWWACRHFAKNRDLNMDYARFCAAFKTDLDYYNSVQPDERKPLAATAGKGPAPTNKILTQYDENGVPI